jgi:hypothetical protein
MALAHRRPYGIYRLLANAPRWFYRLHLGWVLGHRVGADYPSWSQERIAP